MSLYFMNSEFWKRFKGGKLVVHCLTEENANNFLKHCEENNINWVWAKATEKNYYYRNNENTCYRFNKEDFTLSVSSILYYSNDKYDIIEYTTL